MRVFLSAGEPSGDLHAASLAHHLRELEPEIELMGFGGPKAAAAGVALHYELANLAVMGFSRVIKHLPQFFKIARQAEVFFRREKPDALVVIDYPGFHFELAKRAHRAGIPVYYFVPPQLWAWRGGRVKKIHRWFRSVLTALPFEDEWYRSRGVNTHYVGHPYFDELQEQAVDGPWVAEQRSRGGPIVALLPGSRTQEVISNYPLMLQAAERIRAAIPGVRFLTASFRNSQARIAREKLEGTGLPVEVHVGRVPEILEAADVVLAVSGSVGLELMYRLKPSVIVYRVSRLLGTVVGPLLTVKYMSLVNLLVDRVIYPEFPTMKDNPDELAEPLIRWLRDPAAHRATVEELRALRATIAVPGAAGRAAEFLLDDLKTLHTVR